MRSPIHKSAGYGKDKKDGSRTPFLPTTRAGLWHDSDSDDAPLARALLSSRPSSPRSPLSAASLPFSKAAMPRPLRLPIIGALAGVMLLALCAGVFDGEAYWDDYLARRHSYGEALGDALLSKGWVLFEANTPGEVKEVEAVASEGLMSPVCLDKWIAEGVYCEAAKGAFKGTDRLDMVYLWTNGTDGLTSKWRDAIGPRLNKLTARHFR